MLFLFLFLCCTESITPNELQTELDNAIKDPSIDSYSIPQGNYYFNSTDFLIRNAMNFTIYSSTNTIIFLNCSYKVIVINNTNTTINNISIDYDPPCFSQGIIDKININDSSLIVSVDKGYLLPDPQINDIFNSTVIKVIYWNSTNRQQIVGQPTVNLMKSSKQLNNNQYQIYLQKNISTNYVPHIGDLVSIGPRIGGNVVCIKCAAFLCNDCNHVTINNLVIYQAGNMALIELYGIGHNIYNNYQLIRSIKNKNNLLTATADGFHSTQNLYGPILTNSKLMYAADDFINIHNRINILLERISDFEGYIIDTDNGSSFRFVETNSYIGFYQLNTMEYIGYGVVDTLQIVTNETIIQQAQESEYVLQQPPYNASPFKVNYTDLVKVYHVKFQNKLNTNITGYWSLVEIDLNNGAIIRNNIFYNGYVSMAKVKSNNALVENNEVYNTHQGIHVSPSQNWLEGEMGIKNVLIKNNVFVDCDVNQNNVIIVDSTDRNITMINNTVVQ